jgi:hypothetical protein
MDDVVASNDTTNDKCDVDTIDNSCTVDCLDGHQSFLDANKPSSDFTASNPITVGIGLSTRLLSLFTFQSSVELSFQSSSVIASSMSDLS